MLRLARTGLAPVITQYPDLVEVGEDVANWDRTEGQQKTQALMQANSDLNGLIAGNDEMALGAIAALKEANLLDSVVVGGFDGAPDAIDAIKAGEMAYTVLQPVAVFSKEAVEMADAYITEGTEPAEEKVAYDCILINADNVDKMTEPFVYSE